MVDESFDDDVDGLRGDGPIGFAEMADDGEGGGGKGGRFEEVGVD